MNEEEWWQVARLAVNLDVPVSQVLAELALLPREKLTGRLRTDGSTIISFVVQRKDDEGALQVLKYLCEDKGCRPTTIDSNGQTALFFAARDGNLSCCRFLVDQGCNPDQVDNAQQTPLFYACRDGRKEVVAFLLDECNVSINRQDGAGQTALFYAARDGRASVVKEMLARGSDPTIKDFSKKTAHTFAQKKGHMELAAIIKGAMQRRSQSDFRPYGTALQGSKTKHTKSSRGSKSPQSLQPSRSKCRLQFLVQLASGAEVWLFSGPEEAEKFAKEYPQYAVWDAGSQPTSNVAPVSSDATLRERFLQTDAFRLEWSQEALKVVDIVSSYQDCWYFARPVDVKAWNCPDYYDIITEPRDLGMVKKKLLSLEYHSIQGFIRDMELIFSNCFRYNPETSEVHKAGRRAQAFCKSVFEEKRIAEWLQRENELIDYLIAHQMPVTIGPDCFNDPEEQGSQNSPPSFEREGQATNLLYEEEDVGSR